MDDNKKTIPAEALSGLHSELREMRATMEKMAEAVNRLSLLEERQQSVAQAAHKILERVERLEARQHEGELAAAGTSHLLGRIEELSKGFLELHIEREKDKARFSTLLWTVRGLWAVLGSSGVYFLVKVVMERAAG